MDINILTTLQNLFATSENIVLTGAMALVFVLAWSVIWIWSKYDDLRKEAAEEIRKLQGDLSTLNQEFSESNKNLAETLDKIGDTVLKLLDMTTKK